jgi:hypothetical protein
MTDRTDETEDTRGPNQRLAVIASLRPGSRDEAAQLVAKGPPYDLREAGFERHSVFLAAETVVSPLRGAGNRRPRPRSRQRPGPLRGIQCLGTTTRPRPDGCSGGVLLGRRGRLNLR